MQLSAVATPLCMESAYEACVFPITGASSVLVRAFCSRFTEGVECNKYPHSCTSPAAQARVMWFVCVCVCLLVRLFVCLFKRELLVCRLSATP